MDYLDLCRLISQEVKAELIKALSETGFVGETLSNPYSLKSTHRVDKIAIEVIWEKLKDYPCNIYIESAQITEKKNAEFTMIIDPIDGSLNWDRGVGDPCIAIAITQKTKDIQLQDLEYAYVEGFRSGDYYYTQEGMSYFHSHLLQKIVPIHTAGKTELAEATAYLRSGYSSAKKQLEKSFPLFLLCRDLRAIDNSAMEICEVARNAADLIVEARQISDNFNLLAYPILKNAGGLLCDLEGNSLEELSLESEQVVDYVICNNATLLAEILLILKRMQQYRKYTHDNLSFEF